MTAPTWYFGDGASAVADEYGSAIHTYSSGGHYFPVYVDIDGGTWGICEVQVSEPTYVAIGHAAWSAPEDDGGSAVDRYRLFNEAGVKIYEGPDLTFNMGEVNPAASNAVRVQAHNSRGWGPLSAQSPRAVVTDP